MIAVSRKEPGKFAPHHVQLLQTFADQAVIAIQNATQINETREALERQTATADILKVIASSPSDTQTGVRRYRGEREKTAGRPYGCRISLRSTTRSSRRIHAGFTGG